MSTCKENSSDAWRWYVTKHLGRQIRTKAQTLMADILAVDVGIKPGYLYDIGKPDGNRIVDLLRELKTAGLICGQCNVIQIGLDCIIVNVDTLKAMDVTVDSLKGQLIDVSYSRPSPSLYKGHLAREQLYQTYMKIVKTSDSDEIQKHDIPDSVYNVSSLFGLLLGYPILYWYDTEDGCQGNCLSMETLFCAKLNVNFMTHQSNKGRELMTDHTVKHCLFSFSYPSCLGPNLMTQINTWLHVIQKRVDNSQIFSNPEFIQESRTLEVVAL